MLPWLSLTLLIFLVSIFLPSLRLSIAGLSLRVVSIAIFLVLLILSEYNEKKTLDPTLVAAAVWFSLFSIYFFGTKHIMRRNPLAPVSHESFKLFLIEKNINSIFSKGLLLLGPLLFWCVMFFLLISLVKRFW